MAKQSVMDPVVEPAAGYKALTALKKVETVESVSKVPCAQRHGRGSLPRLSSQRKNKSLQESSFDLSKPKACLSYDIDNASDNRETVLYLAYGSNLCAETFRGRRGIKPLAQVNVVVPELVMTFDLAGIPYLEPCFANTKYRKVRDNIAQKSMLKPNSSLREDYKNPFWSKGLVGVVYEVTIDDFAHIIATEGGGASYQDVLVTCHELPRGSATVPAYPTDHPFKAHTLYSPVFPPGAKPPAKGGRFSRPDPEYAQPSARYLKLIRDGADEHGIPQEYKDYLHKLQPYTITSRRQRIGASVFKSVWLPIIKAVFRLNGRFADERGKSPKWLVALTGAIFKGAWVSYDGVFKRVFGDGERTQDEGSEGGIYVDPLKVAVAASLNQGWEYEKFPVSRGQV